MLCSIIQRLREPDDITGPDLLDWSTFALRDTDDVSQRPVHCI
jgi:hypothetical protein